MVNLFKRIENDVQTIHARWLMYRQLYITNQTRIDLLNNTAAFFFANLEEVLLDDILLGICRLGDEADKSLGNKKINRASLSALIRQIHDTGNDPLASSLYELLLKFVAVEKPIRLYRHQLLAHRALKLSPLPTKVTKPEDTVNAIEEALEYLRGFMNLINIENGQDPIKYDAPFMAEDGDALIKVLVQGERYRYLKNIDSISSLDLMESRFIEAI